MSSGVRRAVTVAVAALLAGVFAFMAYAALSPSRITERADATDALEVASSSPASPTPSLPSGTTPTTTPQGPTTRPTPSATRAGGARAAAPSLPPSVQKPTAAAAGFRVEIPSLDVVLPVVPVGVAKDGQMSLPKDPDIAGWYRFGPGPVSEVGASVISAHVDSRDGVGPLAKLPRLDRGARIHVTVGGTRVEYVVERVDRYAKTALDVDALFSREGPARLHLVSCGGEWNPRTRHYEDNVVAIARRASVTEEGHLS